MVTERVDIHPVLKSFIPIAEGIAKTFGSFCEVAIHDFTDYSSSIVAIFNGHITGRTVGSPITNLGLEIMRKGLNGEDTLLNYANGSIPQKKIKSSSLMIRDEAGNLVGCLCINLDLTYFSMAGQIIDGIMMTAPEKDQSEAFSLTITDLEEQLINEASEKIGKPVILMDKTEREEFISYLDEKGLFLIKGAVQKVADLLSISKYTLYNYLEKK